ncbi:MAG: hypothetical protein Q7S26_02810 [bacterium]|nr:hypothetical protein [bacterium]
MNSITTTRAAKWGNSIGVRLSTRIAAQVGITAHSEIALETNGHSIVISPIKKESGRIVRRPIKTLLKHVRHRLTTEDRAWLDMKPVGQEIW